MASIPKIKPERKAKPAPAKETFSLISQEKLLAIYSAMVKCRMVQQRAEILFQQGKLASDLHASSGREATAAGIAIDLQGGDSLSLSAGDWLPAMVKGMALESLFRVLASATPGGFGTPFVSVLEQNNILPAGENVQRPAAICERALAAQAAKQSSIVAAILPSDKQALKLWHDVLKDAASQNLPIVFVHYADAAEQTSTVQHTGKSKNPDAFFHGVPSITVDALDAVAVYRVAYEGFVRARQGRGATLLECATHGGIIPIPGSTSKLEPAAGGLLQADPVTTMEVYLKSKGIDPAQHNRQIVAAFNVELDLATRFLGP